MNYERLTLAEKVFALRSIQCFKGLSDNEIVPIADAAVTVAYNKGERLGSSGRRLRRLYVVIEGTIVAADGRYLPAIMGSASMLFNLPVATDLIADRKTGAKCLLLDRSHFFTIAHQCPSFIRHLAQEQDFEVNRSSGRNGGRKA